MANPDPINSKVAALDALIGERVYQDGKFPDHSHSLGEWIMIARKCLRDAEVKWYAGHGDMEAVKSELCQVGAVCLAALEEHGAPAPRPK